MTIGPDADRMDLYHLSVGHTNGDSGVALPDSLSKAIARLDGIDTVVPGHIPVTTWASLQGFQRFTADLVTAVRSAKRAGQSADQAAGAVDLSSRYPEFESTRIDAAVMVICDELP